MFILPAKQNKIILNCTDLNIEHLTSWRKSNKMLGKAPRILSEYFPQLVQ